MRKPTAFLLGVGLLQMTGDLLRLPALKGIGAATAASPAPRVFSAVRGLETYSTRFFIEWMDRAGRPHVLEVTPELYAKLRGPYNRRNVYGAVLAFGPVLISNPTTRPMFESVIAHALCGEAPLVRELGLDREDIAGQVRLRLEPRPGSDLGIMPFVLEARCS
jgi:hypothetical protein